MRILVAEDDQVIADFVAQGLREAGYADEAIARLRERGIVAG